MPSHLTRQVFRRIIANEPIVYRGCLRRQSYSSIAPSHNGARVYFARNSALPAARRYQQRRTIFGLGGMFRPKAPRLSKDANYDPGIEKMMEYAKMERLRARLPPVEDVAHALRLFWKSKKRSTTAIADTQAQLVLQSLRYCLKMQNGSAAHGSGTEWELTGRDISKLAILLTRMPRQVSQAHLDLARLLHDELSGPQYSAKETGDGFDAYLSSLTWIGKTQEAKQLMQSAEPGLEKDAVAPGEGGLGSKPVTTQNIRRWGQIISGFTRESNEKEILDTLALLRQSGAELDFATTHTILMFYVRKQDNEAVRQWWKECKRSAGTSGETLDYESKRLYQAAVHDLLIWCLHSKDMELGHGIVKDVMSSNPEKRIWDAVLVWGAGTKKSVDEVGRMLDVMEKSNETISDEKNWRVPDSETINALVRYAIFQKDPYMAERFISLGRDRGIQPDAETFILQMDYRLSVNDVDGALIAYKHLQSQDLSTNSDVPAVNRLVVALCTSQRHDFETIMSVVADLSDREADFEPLTVSTLSVLHLNRDEIHDVIDLLNTHSFRFSSAERASIRRNLIDYCLDLKTTTTRAWDAYTILRSVFDEMPREQRTELMLNFFAHERPDMAVNVFNHMRHHTRADTIPDNETYVSAFLGCAKLGDLESLEVVHNQLKLDYNVSQTTYCRNALIIAYSLCEKPRAALDFWDDIVASREGPTYNSIHIALRACEKSAFGDIKAQEIWARLRRNKVELDQPMWASYIAALAGNGDNELAKSVLEEAEQNGELEVDAFLLGSFFDAAPGQSKQADIEMWAEETYPETWEIVKEKIGWKVEESGMRKVNIDRTVTP
ncbi:hypothetical protein Q7P37_006483 [Cladosporium fusiforme]